MTNIIFCNFGLFFALSPTWQPGKSKFSKIEKNTWRHYHFTHVRHNWQSYNVWFLRLCHFGKFFCTFTFLTSQKVKNFKERKCNVWFLRYVSWDMGYNRHNFLSFWVNFCPFTPLTIYKIKILKKLKKHLEVLSFYTWVP